MKIVTRTFQIPTSAGTTISISIHEDASIQADNLHLETWGSSLVLARRLHAIKIPPLSNVTCSSQSQDPSNQRRNSVTSQHGLGPILELGAGTGLVGLSAAALWRTNVVLTDLAPILPALQENVLLNRNLLDGRRGSVACGILDWRDPLALKSYPPYTSHDQSHELLVSPDSEDNKFSMILAADTVYDPAHPEMLVEVIKKWLKRGDESRVLIAYPMRVAYLEEIRELWTRISGIGLEVLEEGKEELPEMEWDDERLVEWCVWKWKV